MNFVPSESSKSEVNSLDEILESSLGSNHWSTFNRPPLQSANHAKLKKIKEKKVICRYLEFLTWLILTFLWFPSTFLTTVYGSILSTFCSYQRHQRSKLNLTKEIDNLENVLVHLDIHIWKKTLLLFVITATYSRLIWNRSRMCPYCFWILWTNCSCLVTMTKTIASLPYGTTCPKLMEVYLTFFSILWQFSMIMISAIMKNVNG